MNSEEEENTIQPGIIKQENTSSSIWLREWVGKVTVSGQHLEGWWANPNAYLW
jgi:hypothetical protein